MELVVETPLPSWPTSAQQARRAVSLGLAGWPGVDTAELLVSELVTNAVLHAAPPLALRVLRDRDAARIEVVDHAAALPERTDPGAGDLRGRGLLLVEALADEWGVTSAADDGKTVWCTIHA